MKIRMILSLLAGTAAVVMNIAPRPGETASGSLQPVTTVTVSAASRFAAADHFFEDVSGRVRVPIAWLGATFRRRFLDKVEEGVEAGALTVYSLRQSAANRTILAELGARPETKLADMWALLARQPAGEPGPLLTDVRANVFYIRDAEGTTWTVDVVWGGAGWEIGATPLDGPALWRAGHQIIAR